MASHVIIVVALLLLRGDKAVLGQPNSDIEKSYSGEDVPSPNDIMHKFEQKIAHMSNLTQSKLAAMERSLQSLDILVEQALLQAIVKQTKTLEEKIEEESTKCKNTVARMSRTSIIGNDMEDVLLQLTKLRKDVQETNKLLESSETEITKVVTIAINNITHSAELAHKNMQNKLSLANVTHDLTSMKKDIKEYISEQCGQEQPNKVHSNCAEIRKTGQTKSGVYPVTVSSKTYQVYCDMNTDGGGWTVFQRRVDVEPRVDFFRGWEDYKLGFGDLNTEFWLGLDAIHFLTSDRPMSLRVDLENWKGVKKYAHYDRFSVWDESEKYQLSVTGYSGDGGDSLSHHNGHPFTTKDRDNDKYSGNCATRVSGAWWFVGCQYSDLNGEYLKNTKVGFSKGVNWYEFTGNYYSLKFTEMKMRPADFKVTK